MLTPRDIHEATFHVVWRGYSEKEVDAFLSKVVSEYEAILQQNEALKKKVAVLESELLERNAVDQEVRDALTAAVRTGNDVKVQAEREAELILREARSQASAVLDQAHRQVKEAAEGLRLLHQQEEAFRKQLRVVLHAYLQLLDEGERVESESREAAATVAASLESTNSLRAIDG